MPRYRQLDPELKAKWIDALRSGNYGQATGFLRESGVSTVWGTAVPQAPPPKLAFTNNFCCLGVLCDVIDPGAWKLIDYYNSEHGKVHPLAETDEEFLVNDGPVSRGAQLRLGKMNDSGESFDEIADWIEKNL